MQLENRLWASAVQAARAAGMEFTVPCARNVRDLIRAGVGVMRRENRTAESDLEAADASLALLAGEMVHATREFGESADARGSIRIRESALVRAKNLCPLWPFG